MGSDSSLCFFSVIIPLYNKADTIVRTLKSVSWQKFRDFEVVVVDDGSKDDGVAVVEAFNGIERIRLIRQENAGVSAARNRGVAEARGRYMAFLDADDEWHPDYLQELSLAIRKIPDAVVYGANYANVVGDLYATGQYVMNKRIRRIDLFSVWSKRCPIHTSSAVIEREAFMKAGGFNPASHYFEDAELLFKLALLGGFVVSKRVLVKYHTDAIVRATGGAVDYGRYAHWWYLERSLRENNPNLSLVCVARMEMHRRFVYNYLLDAFGDSKRLKELFYKMAETTSWRVGLLMRKNPIGTTWALLHKLWWGLGNRIQFVHGQVKNLEWV